jgi:hypothetical protein
MPKGNSDTAVVLSKEFFTRGPGKDLADGFTFFLSATNGNGDEGAHYREDIRLISFLTLLIFGRTNKNGLCCQPASHKWKLLNFTNVWRVSGRHIPSEMFRLG